MEQLINDITTAFGHLFSGTALSGNDIQCIVLCAMLVISFQTLFWTRIGWFFEDVWHWFRRNFTTHSQSLDGESIRQEENP